MPTTTYIGRSGQAAARPKNRRGGGTRLLLLGIALVAVVAGAIVYLAASDSTSAPPPIGAGYWHTSGIQILDSYNRPVRIAGVTWFGAEAKTWVPAGLDFQPYQKIMREVKKLGYNTIRLPFCNQLVEQNPIVTSWVNKNPEFLGKHALFVLDAIVDYAETIGLKIILDDQVSACQSTRKTSGKLLNEPLWYTRRYPQSAWLHDWVMLAKRYRGNTAVIGFDLRNEPHTNWEPAPARCCNWTLRQYLHNGSTWGPYNGVDRRRSDWRLAAERAGDAILRVNPKLLIIVEGLQLYPQRNQPGGVDSYWWGGILKQLRRYPVRLIKPHQLVYSPHEYGPQKWPYYWWWRQLTYKRLRHVLNQQWGFMFTHPHASWAAPIYLGETGTCTNYTFCYSPSAGPPSPNSKTRTKREQGEWLHLLVRYIRQHPSMGWSLWALNGTNALDQTSTDGLLNRSWNAVQTPAIQRLLRTIQSPMPRPRTS